MVTASVDPVKTLEFWGSWEKRAAAWADVHKVLVVNSTSKVLVVNSTKCDVPAGGRWGSLVLTSQILGTVPAFALGVKLAIHSGADVIACFHDDLRIDQDGWDQVVLEHFAAYPMCGLAGFGGALGLGRNDIYLGLYDPIQLVREDFISNMQHAEAHGRREVVARKVAVLDGFSQIGTARFFSTAWPELEESGIVHHAYDAYLGALAAERGLESWFLPVACHHHGGLTAAGSPAYNAWATERFGGDGEVWKTAHRITYQRFKGQGVLPLRVR